MVNCADSSLIHHCEPYMAADGHSTFKACNQLNQLKMMRLTFQTSQIVVHLHIIAP